MDFMLVVDVVDSWRWVVLLFGWRSGKKKSGRVLSCFYFNFWAPDHSLLPEKQLIHSN